MMTFGEIRRTQEKLTTMSSGKEKRRLEAKLLRNEWKVVLYYIRLATKKNWDECGLGFVASTSTEQLIKLFNLDFYTEFPQVAGSRPQTVIRF